MELRGESGGAAVGMVARAELQRILQMLQAEVVKANWSINPSSAPAAEELVPKPARH